MDKELAKYIQEHGIRLKEKKMKAEEVDDAAMDRMEWSGLTADYSIMEADEPSYDPKKEI